MLRTIRILVVDDNRQDIFLFTRMLKSVRQSLACKIGVCAVLSGKEAVYKIASQKFEFVFLDQQMPGLDGLQTFEEIARLIDRDDTPPVIIGYSNCELKAFKNTCLNMGMSESITKYLTGEKFIRLVEKYYPQCAQLEGASSVNKRG